MKSIAALCAALSLAWTASAHAVELYQSEPIRPVTKLADVMLEPHEALVVVGYAIRNADVASWNEEYPVFMGWMPFDDKTGLRIGKVMLTATERCSRAASMACDKVQHRVYRVPAGSYALAWAFNSKRMTSYVESGRGGLEFHRHTGDIRNVNFPDQARVRLGLPAFRVNAGEVLYVGDLALSFQNKVPRPGWLGTRDDAAVLNLMKESRYADRLAVRSGTYIGR